MHHPSPPRPRAAFRVGVVGHRRDKLPVTADADVQVRLREVMDLVVSAVDQHVLDYPSLYRPESPTLTLLSALAEGADRLGASCALAHPRWRLHAVLPFQATDYLRDFEQAAAEPDSGPRFQQQLDSADRVTVLDGRAGAWEAYVPLGQVIIDSVDLLVAVWDGKESNGPGGTGNVVRRARHEGVPVIRITPTPGSEAWLEELIDSDHGRRIGLSRLPERLATLLRPPSDQAAAERWFAETVGPRRVPRLYAMAIRSLTWLQQVRRDLPVDAVASLQPDPGSEARDRWRTGWAELPLAVVHPLVDRFASQYGWADALGRWHAAAFRSSFSAVFLLAVASVVSGGLLQLQPAAERSWLWIVIPILEPLLLGAMLYVVWRGRRERHHERWLSYRSLAERTRHLATLWPLARTSSVARVLPEPLPHDPRLGWVDWLLRATVREAGLVSGRLDGDFAVSARQMVLRRESSEQRAFHSQRRSRLEHLSGPLEHFAQRLVAIALVLAILRLSELAAAVIAVLGNSGADKSHESALVEQTWIILAAASTGLPALAAGIHGFLGIADFEGTAFRSASIEGRLADLEGRLRRLDPVDLTSVADLTVEMTRTMEGELGAWHSATASRRLQAN